MMAQDRVSEIRIMTREGFGFACTHSRIADTALSAAVIIYKVEILGILMGIIINDLFMLN